MTGRRAEPVNATTDGGEKRSQADETSDARSTSPTGWTTRRRVLRTGAVAGLIGLAGCTEDVGSELPPNTKWPVAELTPSLPIETRADRFDASVEAAAGADVSDVETFADVVTVRVPRLESVREDRDVLSVAYVTDVDRSEGIGNHVAALAGAYAALVDAGYDAYALGTTILESPDEPIGSTVVYTDWASAYNAGRYTTAEYRELVWTTIKSTRHPPTVEVEPDE
ncbi:hypothetical protein C479_14043 [Halovivax asiaticus JCM 14624]|uniref:DUF8159 domain-containing protein n=1 Tax=Halovivax asiaticus JCM 14624 TaxID=1227490 RepID=M0BC29_9EURY|nr:hypothetical protein [Halovivax asiaticus]ELZ08466.1 hypothetical protein C479_14043 [Halovivax asiaticus JCM 14624]